MISNNFSHCFALLDDSDATATEPTSRLYTDYLTTLSATRLSDVPQLFESMQTALAQGQHAVALFAYELGNANAANTAASTASQPPAGIMLFGQCQRLSTSEVDAWLSAQKNASTGMDGTEPAGIAHIHANVTEPEFSEAIAKILDYIEAGDTYQVNYTYRLHFETFGSLHALYLRLRARQPVPYGALIGLPDGSAVLSLSPELFVRHAHGKLTARPMKGTAIASGNLQQDAASSVTLRSGEKNRAENVMIVDLLRNDFGRIATVGSVQVSELFDVTRYSSVLQMTSTVHADLRDDLTLGDIFMALFPCGSITGAPKRRTMEIIHALETEPRGIYTGAIGWFDAPDRTALAPNNIGDFCLSVPIRTIELQAPDAGNVRKAKMGVGAGIVYDSKAADEYAECQWKVQFLTGLPNEFELFETMHATLENGCRYLDLHLQRLQNSAAYFGFHFDEAMLRIRLDNTCSALRPNSPYRLRLAINQAGECKIQSSPLLPLSEPVRVLLATERTRSSALFLRHKTTVRERYDAAWRNAENHGAFDTLFFNEHGELTEGGRSNVFLQIGGRWYTPPLSAGVLPGIMRTVLLEDKYWDANERVLTMTDLRSAEKIIVCNSLRRTLNASVIWDK